MTSMMAIPEGIDYAPSPRRLPNSVADDHRLGSKTLCVLTYRIAHGDNFGLNKKEVKKRFNMGAPTFYASLDQLKELGYLTRTQSGPRSNGGFRYAVDQVNLSVAPDGRGGYVLWSRSSFEKIYGMHAHLVGVLVYLHSHAPTYAATAWKVAARFGISERTAKEYLGKLVQKGLVATKARRDTRGRYSRSSYHAVRPISMDVDPDAYEEWFYRFSEEINIPREARDAFEYADPIDQPTEHDWILQRLLPLVERGQLLPLLLEDERSLDVLKKIMIVQGELAEKSPEEAAEDVVSGIKKWCDKNPNRPFKSWSLIGIQVLLRRHIDEP